MIFFRKIFDTFLPKGQAWTPRFNGYMDKLFDGISACFQYLYDRASDLSVIRDPLQTDQLDDLEKEFGVLSTEAIVDSDRRKYLNGIVYQEPGTGSDDDLESRLHAAGFDDLFVYQNDHARDPESLIYGGVGCGEEDAYCGGENAFCGKIDGYLLINGNSYLTPETYITKFPQYLWPFVFIVSGAKDGYKHEIGLVKSTLKSKFERLVLATKPQHSWALILINFYEVALNKIFYFTVSVLGESSLKVAAKGNAILSIDCFALSISDTLACNETTLSEIIIPFTGDGEERTITVSGQLDNITELIIECENGSLGSDDVFAKFSNLERWELDMGGQTREVVSGTIPATASADVFESYGPLNKGSSVYESGVLQYDLTITRPVAYSSPINYACIIRISFNAENCGFNVEYTSDDPGDDIVIVAELNASDPDDIFIELKATTTVAELNFVGTRNAIVQDYTRS